MADNLSAVTRWWAFVQRTSGAAAQKEIAEASGVSQPTVSRWAKGEIEAAGADVAVRFAVHYGASVGEALVASGVLTEADLPVTIQRYETPDDDTLVRLIAERLHRDREEPGDGNATPTTNEVDAARRRRTARRIADATEDAAAYDPGGPSGSPDE